MDVKGKIKKYAKDGAPIIVGGYLKRKLEKAYDAVFQTKVGQKIKNADSTTRHGLEFLLYILTIFFDKKFPAKTILQKTVKEVGGDVASSLGKRIINGSPETKTPEIQTNNPPMFEVTKNPNPLQIAEPEKESELNAAVGEATQKINETTEAIERLRTQYTKRRN